MLDSDLMELLNDMAKAFVLFACLAVPCAVLLTL
jgi:hypothetical protein